MILLFIAAYILGAIPFGVMIARAHGVVILKMGSGNPGATNVKRVLGSKAGYTVFALDVLKGLLPAVAARFLIKEQVGPFEPQFMWLLVGLTAVLGHCLSPFLGFRGGKGIATSLGAGVAAAPLVALPAFVVFIAVMAATHYVSLASMVAIASTLVWVFVFPDQSKQLVPAFVLLTAVIIIRHKANIKRLMDGTESKSYFGEKKDLGAGNVPEGTESRFEGQGREPSGTEEREPALQDTDARDPKPQHPMQ